MRNQTNSLWTDERMELLKGRWAAGRSASQIREELGPEFSRNAVIGKIKRMGIQRRGKSLEPSSPRPHRSNFNPSFSFSKKPTVTPPVAEEQKEYVLGHPSTSAQGVPLTDSIMEIVGKGKQASIRWSGGLQPGQCKWVVNTQERGGEYLFCGGKIATHIDGKPADKIISYCPHHCRMAYVAPSGCRRKVYSRGSGTPSERRAGEAA